MQSNKERYGERKANGLCVECGEKAIEGRIMCNNCKERNNNYQRQRLQNMKKNNPKRYRRYLDYMVMKETAYHKTKKGKKTMKKNNDRWRRKNPMYMTLYRRRRRRNIPKIYKE